MPAFPSWALFGSGYSALPSYSHLPSCIILSILCLHVLNFPQRYYCWWMTYGRFNSVLLGSPCHYTVRQHRTLLVATVPLYTCNLLLLVCNAPFAFALWRTYFAAYDCRITYNYLVQLFYPHPQYSFFPGNHALPFAPCTCLYFLVLPPAFH